MKCVAAGGLVIDPIKQRLAVADVMEGAELRAIEEASAPCAIQRNEVAVFRRTPSETRAPTGVAERAIGRVDIAERRRHAQPRTRCDLRYQAGFVAELGVRRSGCERHTLNRANGKLS